MQFPLQHSRSLLCIFIPALLYEDAEVADVEQFGQMAQAMRQTWGSQLTNRMNSEQNEQKSVGPVGQPVFVVLPEKGTEPPNLLEKLQGLQTLHLPEQSSQTWGLRALHFWHFVVSLMQEAGGNGQCDWIMKVPVSSYVNVPTLESRLSCFNASEQFFLGVPTVAYSPGHEPFMFPNQLGGVVVSRGFFDHVKAWTDYCIKHADSTEAPYGSGSFFEDYTFSMCLSDLGHITVGNYADMETSFVLFERPNHTIQMFEKHADTLKQCLLVVGQLELPQQMVHVHDRISWSKWHTSIPCVGESQMGKFSISDAFGNAKAYYDERIRLALYYCKASEFMDLEKSLAERLHGIDPRSGTGALASPIPPPAEERQHLCIFVPSSARKQRFVRAAEEAWKVWGTNNTFFVSKQPLSLLLDGQTFLLETDIDTDYAHLPVRTFLLFEALGRPEWVSACDWYMKADADSFLNVPLIEQRLRCFDPADFWFLGVPQVAHSSRGVMTRFASGGAGYIISRALLPKLSTWSPFCLLQLLQHAGGTGMEDVSLAGCIWRWGRVEVVSYADYETEVITSEAALNRTRVVQKHEPHEALAVPPCAMVVHSVSPEELPVVRDNIQRARRERPQKCIPDQQRLAHGASMVLSPETPETSEVPADSYQWSVYAEREYQALLVCSKIQEADAKTL